jgi:hypothetical protein
MIDKLLESEHLKDFSNMIAFFGLVEEFYHEQIGLIGLSCVHQKGKKVLVVAKYLCEVMHDWTQLARMPSQVQDQGRQ